MNKTSPYTSSISHHISGFLDEKRALGFKYEIQARMMMRFDEYWAAHGYDDTGLTLERLEDWLMKKDGEGSRGLKGKITLIREFSRYLLSLSIPSYVPFHNPISESSKRYIPNPARIKAFFEQVDNYKLISKNKYIIRMHDEYPVLFRFIYLHGLRVQEACNIHIRDIDFASRTVQILNAKGNKDRLIYLATDFNALCSDYTKYMSTTYGNSEWLFPGQKLCNPISACTVSHAFHKLWMKTPYGNTCSKAPTVHDLRHAYVVQRINLWIENGLNFEQMLPYLSKFLGHKSFLGTYYYYHYEEEAAKLIQKKDTVINNVIPEVMRR